MFRLILVVLGFLISTVTFAQNNNAIEDKVNAALASEIRTTAEKARDRNRKPLETLNFFQLKDDMRVLELVPGGGWYTKLLAPVLKAVSYTHLTLPTKRIV